MSSDSKATTHIATVEVGQPIEEPGRKMLRLFVDELVRRLEESPKDMTAAEFTVVARLLSDNSISLASIKAGDFGEVARKAAEEFPFPEGPQFVGEGTVQ